MLIDAVAVFEETHVTEPVKSCVELSVNTPIAVNCSVLPLATLGAAGVTPTDTNEAAVTDSVTAPDKPDMLAVTVADPGVTALARPAALTVATGELLELHVTLFDKILLGTIRVDTRGRQLLSQTAARLGAAGSHRNRAQGRRYRGWRAVRITAARRQ